MKGLLLRLSALDADAAAAVRVIAHFQALLGVALDAPALVRSTAGLAECPAGLELADGRSVRCGPDGAPLTGRPAHVSGSARVSPAGRVWLERPGTRGPFDDLVLEWMAIAAAALGATAPRGRPPQVSDPLLVERVLSAHEPVADRAQALRRLGLDPAGSLRVAAVSCRDGAAVGPVTVTLLGRGDLPGVVRVARMGSGAVVLHQCAEGTPSPGEALRTVLCDWVAAGTERPGGARPGGIRAGVGGATPALQARTSWEQARTALRFTVADPPHEAVADHDALGPAALLADIPVRRLYERPEVRALVVLAEQPGGRAAIGALAAFCRTGSLRQAAAELHLHHSSVAGRLARVERALGRGLSAPHDRFGAHIALYAHRLATAPEQGPPDV